MFDYQKLEVYQKVRAVNKQVYKFLKSNPPSDRYIKDQWSRATLSIALNIVEGSSRFGRKEKRQFYIVARSSAMECVAAMEALLDQKGITETEFNHFASQYESITRMLFKMIQTFSDEKEK